MRRLNEQSIGEVLSRIIRENGLQDKLDEALVMVLWDEQMGPSIARRTRSLRLQGGRLHVQVDSSVLREELLRQKTQVIQTINEAAGKELVQELAVF